MAINLFISLFDNPVRNTEHNECLKRNIASKLFSHIFILAEGEYMEYLPGKEVPFSCYALPIDKRPTFRSFFNSINHITSEHDINIIANSDIYFKELPLLPETHQCFALTRYEPAFFLNRSDSQDVWMFRGHISQPRYCDFGMGVPGCDNRIAYELSVSGYEVINPSLTIKTYHLHNIPTDHSKSTKRIGQPYLKLKPCTGERHYNQIIA